MRIASVLRIFKDPKDPNRAEELERVKAEVAGLGFDPDVLETLAEIENLIRLSTQDPKTVEKMVVAAMQRVMVRNMDSNPREAINAAKVLIQHPAIGWTQGPLVGLDLRSANSRSRERDAFDHSPDFDDDLAKVIEIKQTP